MKKNPPSSQEVMGSTAWLAKVYTTPPVRDPGGRSRPTERFVMKSRYAQQRYVVEGGNELTAALLLDILYAAGLVKRYKPQPFVMYADVHGVDATPDFLFEWAPTSIHFVAEVKSSSYLDPEKLRKVCKVGGAVVRHGLRYCLWNTKEHMTDWTWTNVRQTHKLKNMFPDDDTVDKLCDLLATGPKTLGHLLDAGVDQDTVLHRAWHGHAHFDMCKKRTVATAISAQPRPEYYHHLLNASPDPESWWNALGDS
jgi:hypothetical protein